MRSLLIGLVLTGTIPFVTGCATTGYSGGFATAKLPEQRCTGENANNVFRNWVIESRQIADDTNSVLLLDPASRLTPWNLR